ncbi:piRNA biogenesis protein EXD1-like [Periplaneta americana]|uniref:piRNA biogenesis protein EXD1-like n=1 Tax=Periplaneta americana TaxID=6978 RepID=UPI0037E7E7CD
MDAVMKENYSEKIFLETETDTIEGVIIDSSDDKKFTLTKVVRYPSGEEYDGVYHYCKDEVKNVCVLKYINSGNEIICGNSSDANHFLTGEEYDRLIALARDTVFIDCTNSLFGEAIETINKETIIGIDAKGVSHGRQSDIELFSIYTRSSIYQFDILKLGRKAFDSGLRTILNGTIVKVIHNSRLLSDCLYHQYSVKLENVFDTQVGELMVERNVTGKIPDYVCNLKECVNIFLGVPSSLVHSSQDDAMWSVRPLTPSVMFAAARDVVFLLALQERIEARLLSRLKKGTELFLTLVRDSENDEANFYIGRNHLVPKQFLEFEFIDV